jgi:hypothetical protein
VGVEGGGKSGRRGHVRVQDRRAEGGRRAWTVEEKKGTRGG